MGRSVRKWLVGRSLVSLALALVSALALTWGAQACGNDDDDGGTGVNDQVSELEIEDVSGDSLTLTAGGSQTISVEAQNDDGDDIDDAVITASSSNAAVATVSGGTQASRIRLAHTDFTVQAVAAGTAVVTFRHAPSNTSANLSVRVSAGGPAPPPPPPPPPAGGVTIMTGTPSGNVFSPSSVSVTAGTRVTWDWNNPNPHSVTSDAGAFNSGAPVAGTGNTFSFTFSTPGTFPYFCVVHGAAGGLGMSGTVTVTP